METFRSHLARIARKNLLFLGLLLFFSCVDPYSPPSTSVNYSYLVVDGILNVGTDTIVFTLSHTRPVNSTGSNAPEAFASVTIEEQNGQSYPMISDFRGNYRLAPGLVDAAKNLRMHIFSNGNEYVSPYVEVVVNPAIDSISWKTYTLNAQPGVQLYVNTHDPASNTRFYRWAYEETWEYNSKFSSDYIYTDGLLLLRTPDQLIYHCYNSDTSRQVLLTSTTALSEDVIREFPLVHIPQGSPKVSIRYSILAHQYALTKEAYQYWQSIQKNTENLGTLFGSLPVQVTGNFTCVNDPSIPALGFFSATQQQEKRIFIKSSDLPPVSPVDPFYDGCESQLLPLDLAGQGSTSLYLYAVYQQLVLIGYQIAPARCTDCRLHGGTTAQPSYW